MSSNHKREQKEEIEKLQKSQKIVNKMEISLYLSMVTLNVNGLNFPIERYRQRGWMDLKTQKNTHLYAAYKRLTSPVMTQRDWRRGDRERYALQMEI